MDSAPGFVDGIARAIEHGGVDLRAWGLAWARAAPSVVLIPAFGLRGAPGPMRAALGLALVASVAPAVAPTATAGPWLVSLVVEVFRGLPVAISASLGLWVAAMVGGLADDLRGSSSLVALPGADAPTSPLGALLGLLAAVVFLAGGGPGRVAAALARPVVISGTVLERLALDVAAGVGVAVAVAAPIVVAAIVLEVASALIARAAGPVQLTAVLGPLRSILLLAVVAVLAERIAAATARLVATAPS